MKGNKKTNRRKKLIVVNQTRFIIASLLTLIILSGLISLFTNSIISEAKSTIDSIELTVNRGDTLWEIASEYNYYNEDLREVVYRIKQYNNLDDSRIFVGQTLEIPVSNK
ncbi:cell division suppressor protein YneA [Fusibacter tunisiensis]|uniref:LysM domain-containing protein n=1 Tax=Fusibacter tunisiensis TaxID=1008308 RepID=A0ABS2MMM1_9FIRM|nr:LysM peptidoglycan-binding domain-containing protein [Fusibacter tunisiensis]MBM7560650.1 hypothetical protein [Fusibacter tunisiensis]